MKVFCLAISFLTLFSASAEVPAFDSDKPSTTFTPTYSQVFNNWNSTVFSNQWDAVGTFTSSPDYMQFLWSANRIIRSKTTYNTPYTFSNAISWEVCPTSDGGIVIRASSASPIEALQEYPAGGTFNKEGIAFFPSPDYMNMNIQFSAVNNGTPVSATRIIVPKPAGVATLKVNGTIRIEDFGTTIYVYYNGARFIRIDLGGKTGNIYTSGTVYDADMVSKGTFADMEVEAVGKVGVAQRNSNIRLYSAEIKTGIINTGLNNLVSTFKTYQSGSSIVVDLTVISGQQSVSVFDIQGINRITCIANGGEKLSIPANLKTGVYFVKVQGLDKTMTTKLFLK